MDIIGLTVLGLVLHAVVGYVGGRAIAYLDSSRGRGHSAGKRWGTYVLVVAMLIGYGQAAGIIARALKEHEAVLVMFAAVLLVAAWMAFVRHRD